VRTSFVYLEIGTGSNLLGQREIVNVFAVFRVQVLELHWFPTLGKTGILSHFGFDCPHGSTDLGLSVQMAHILMGSPVLLHVHGTAVGGRMATSAKASRLFRATQMGAWARILCRHFLSLSYNKWKKMKL
jgi:hypothetical protein